MEMSREGREIHHQQWHENPEATGWAQANSDSNPE
jgi:hypothetical protein